MKEEGHILEKLNNLKKNTNSNWSTPYTVPKEYFETIEQNILKKIKLSFENKVEERHLPYNASIGSTYKVPANYFDNLEGRLLNQIQRQKKQSVSFKLWYRVAAAAMIAGIITVAATFLFNNSNTSSSTNPVSTATAIKSINSNELDNFVGEEFPGIENTTQKSVDIDQLFKNIKNEELEHFIDENTIQNSKAL